MKRLPVFFMFVCLLFLFLAQSRSQVWAKEQAPFGPRCIATGPVPLDDPTFCGCTWGYVYYRGQPLFNAPVALAFQSQMTATVSQPSVVDPVAYYSLSGAALGAKLNDTMTATTTIAGQTVARAFRARPNHEREQEVPLVIPEQGEWQLILTAGYTHTLQLQEQTLWAGGPAGLIAVDLTTRQVTTQTLPWPTPTVRAFAIGANNAHWVAGPHHLATLRGQAWQAIPTPFAATIRAIAFHPQSGQLWVGGGDDDGALARYDGQSWQTVSAIDEPIMTLALDAQGGLWVGAWEGGVYYHPVTEVDLNRGWQQYRTQDGLGSDLVRTLAVSANQLWVGGEPYLDTNGYHGGISRYDLSAGSWRTYTTTHGLPADAALAGAPATIQALAVGSDGLVWAGLPGGVHFQAAANLWLTDTVAAAPISALVAAGDRVVAAQENGALLYLDRRVTPGQPPVAQLTAPPAQRLALTATLHLTATATDQDEAPAGAAAQVLAWDWRSDIDGPLCTTAGECTLPANTLTVGTHTISLRVQDDEGVWSAPVTTTFQIGAVMPVAPKQLYLPLILGRAAVAQ